ncbi:36206_t:CDS:1 [Gigaspora margarita]|uniref:36206_t:CDS:1 n=1 Tax=Gigaspora margarita TaxID=4874 RepID=A0ABN7UN52_GIGMA|nr:36206_t:CDS:1 [Gigaspora margarita]
MLNEDGSQVQNQINNSHQINMDHSSIPSDPPPPFPGSSPPQLTSSQPSFPRSDPPQFLSSQQQVFVQSSTPQSFYNHSSSQQVFPNQFPQEQQQYTRQVNQGQYLQEQQQPQFPQFTYQQANMGFSPTQQQMRGVPNQQQTNVLPQEQIVYIIQDPPPPVRVMNPNQGYINITSHTPTRVTCPHCNNSVVTLVTEDLGATAWFLVIILCLVFWPLVWLPCVVSSFKNKTHTCPNCRHVLGVVNA